MTDTGGQGTGNGQVQNITSNDPLQDILQILVNQQGERSSNPKIKRTGTLPWRTNEITTIFGTLRGQIPNRAEQVQHRRQEDRIHQLILQGDSMELGRTPDNQNL
jgi:hypothetical protein